MAGKRLGNVSHTGLLLVGILCLALGLRLWGIGFGLPHRYHIDEPYTVLGALKDANRDFAPRLPPNSPNLWEFVLLAEYGVLFVVGKLAGFYGSAWEFANSYRVDPTWFYLLGRGTSAVFGTATVAIVYVTACDVYRNRQAGLLAALLLAVAFVPGRDAHYAVADTFVAFLTTLGVCLWVRYAQGKSAHALLTGSLLVGIAGGIKWRPVGLGTGLLAAVLLRGSGSASRQRAGGPILLRLLLAGLVFVIGFLVGFPGLLISRELFRWHVGNILSWGSPVKVWPQESSGGMGWLWYPLPGWQFYLGVLARGLGVPLLLSSLCGMAQALWRRHRGELAILASVLGYYATISLVRPYFVRYALPLFPLLAILSSGPLSGAVSCLKRRWQAASSVAITALVIGLAAIPFAQLVRHDYLLTQTDTRTLAKLWVEAHVPDGARIAVDWPVHTPPFAQAGDIEPNSSRTYDVIAAGKWGLLTHPPEWYREQEVDYLIASSFIYAIPMKDGARDAERLAFYAALDQEFELVQEFWPNERKTETAYAMDEIFGPWLNLWQRDRPGPTLKVYRVRP